RSWNGRLGRDRTIRRLVGPSTTTPAQPGRQPTSQQGDPPDRHYPAQTRRRSSCLRRPPHERRQNQERSHPGRQTLRHPKDLENPQHHRVDIGEPHGAVSGVGEWHEVPRGRGPQDRKGSTVVSRPASLAPPALEVVLVGATAPYLPPHYVRRQGPSPFAYGSGRQTAAQPAAGGLIPFAYGSGACCGSNICSIRCPARISGEAVGIEEITRTPLIERVEERLLELSPGRLVELVGEPGGGLTRLGMRMLAEHSRIAPVVVVDTR